jgi:hypothetical protein
MKWKRSILVWGIIGVFILWFLLRPWQFSSLFHTQKDVIGQVFTSQEIFDVVMSSQQVTAQLLDSDTEELNSPILSDKKSKPVLLSPDQAQEIKNLLGKPSSYVWGIMSGCIPRYGVIFNFRSGGHTVRVAFCFRCHAVGVFEGDGDNARDLNDGIPFDPMRKQLIALCKTLFPQSQKIQALK